ncbi:tetratricopeptide repeat-containing sulfotransferase family protein [Sagittula salina]|uniref:Sulfotransferase n=1 Tax=Sagittula salina TaxID=2820268 RepID=A0A940MSI9_9RHOB|nr:sulfotransferase [Sagittula salina]MBP0484021.1 sulfotransferase [Sagittula salina]
MTQAWVLDPPQGIIDGLVRLHEAGENAVVAEEARKLLEAFPASYTLWQILGGVLLELGQYGPAELALGQAVTLRPDIAEAQANHSTALRALERIDEAETRAREALRLDAGSVRAMMELSAVLIHRGAMMEVVKICDQVLRLDRTAWAAMNTRGVALQAMGRLPDARRAFEAAIREVPTFAEAHRNLSALKPWTAPDAHLAQMLAIHDDAATEDPDRMRLSVALFRAYDKMNQPEVAWPYLAEANALRKAAQGYEFAADAELFAHIRAVFGDLEPLAAEAAPVVPIFILGMPRSGTTLSEQIMSSHGSVTGAGELGVVNALAQHFLSGAVRADAAGLTAFRAAYFEAVAPLAQGRAFVTDKMPHNFRYAGLIAAAFPEAKIVHVTRDARAVCWSNLAHYFVAEGLGYANDAADVVGFHGLYREMMDFWEKRWPGRIRVLDYEALVENPEAETRALISDLGLPWDEACLRPEDNRRAVQTASTAQVRRRVYKGSSAAWKRYEPWVGTAFSHLPEG